MSMTLAPNVRLEIRGHSRSRRPSSSAIAGVMRSTIVVRTASTRMHTAATLSPRPGCHRPTRIEATSLTAGSNMMARTIAT